MIIKNKKQFAEYKEVCDLSVEILGKIKNSVKKGVKTIEIENYADQLCNEYNVKPAFKGVSVGKAPPYKYATCISLNDTVVHGIPGEEEIKPGDIVKIDFGIIKNGYYTDHCFTVGVKPLSDEEELFIIESRNAIIKGTQEAIIDNTIGDIGHVIESHAKKYGYSVAKDFVGHSIGRQLHEPPDVPAYGFKGVGSKLEKGLVLCIEAQIIDGEPHVYVSDDGWTVKTKNGQKACMFEYIVMVNKKEPKVLTNTFDWELFVD